MPSGEARRSSPAAQRNRAPILDVLRRVLPDTGLVLEIAAGTGEHAAWFAQNLPGLTWQPSDPSPEARASIAAWVEEAGLANLRPPLALDAAADAWPVARADAIVCINMVHISPWEATEGLMRSAGRLLPPAGALVLYGPYRRTGHAIQPSNAAFDADLRHRDPRWGLRLLDDVTRCANAHRLKLDEVAEMPANNLSVIFRRA